MTTAGIALCDEQVLFRTALSMALPPEGPFRVVLQVSTVDELVAQFEATRPDLVIVSSTLTGGGHRAACRFVAGRSRVLVLSETSDHATLVSALEAGAQGYLSKDVDLPALTAAFAALLRGEAVVPPAMLGGLLHELVVQRRQHAPERQDRFRLSRREREVLELLVEGNGQQGIAESLVISPQTARTHIQNVIVKLGVHSRVEAVALALDKGLVRAS